MDNSTHSLAPSTSGDRLALQIREALGPHNDDELPVVELVRRLAAERTTSEAQVVPEPKLPDRFVLNNPRPFIVPIGYHHDQDRQPQGCAQEAETGPVPGTGAGYLRSHEPQRPARSTGQKGRGGARGTTTLLTGNHAYLAAPTLVDVAHGEVGQNGSRRWSNGAHSAEQPCKTVTASGNQALVSAFLTKYRGENAGSAGDAPFPTLTANGESERPGGNPPLAVAVHMEQANAGNYEGGGRAVDAPLSTITAKGCQQQLVATSLVKLRGDNIGSQADAPLHTVSAQGFHHAEVRAFLVAYYGNEKDGRDCAEPMGTVVSRERFGLVTVNGTDYAIADIGLRMLTPRELFRAQGFPEDYVIDRGADGRKLPKDAQVRMCGNSVCPPIAAAVVRANYRERQGMEVAA